MSILSKLGKKVLGIPEQHITMATIASLIGIKTTLDQARPDIESWIKNEALSFTESDNAAIADKILAETGINVTPDVVIALLVKFEAMAVDAAIAKIDTLFDHSAATTPAPPENPS